jgi:hypothetical protein
LRYSTRRLYAELCESLFCLFPWVGRHR